MPFPVIPTVAETERIAAITQPVLRNLLITQCYYELSAAIRKRTGEGSNWCTYAAWASRQAGYTIRKEDLQHTLVSMVGSDPSIQSALALLVEVLKSNRLPFSLEHIKESALWMMVEATAVRSGEAVSRGNKKVFEEIAREFARFIDICLNDVEYDQQHLDDFLSSLKPGEPPGGQNYLKFAFTHYYNSFFEKYPDRKTELNLLANLEIGFHEQTRLQPEILEALTVVPINVDSLGARITGIVLEKAGRWNRLLWVFKKATGHSLIPKSFLEDIARKVESVLRSVLTAHLMTLSLPPTTVLRLGRDLALAFPDQLRDICEPELLTLLKRIDPTPGSLIESGAADWADLQERLHFIADMFRCYHNREELFQEVFTKWQVAEMREGRIPSGPL